MRKAEAICSAAAGAFTPIRRRVFEAILTLDRPATAYQLLHSLNEQGPRVQPPTVYRALEYLRRQGLVHRIDSLNAFMACRHAERVHDAAFLVCTRCGGAFEIEAPEAGRALAEAGAAAGFVIERTSHEMRGLCRACVAAG